MKGMETMEEQELKEYEVCPGCGSTMVRENSGNPEYGTWMECPNPNCDWFAD